MIAWAALLAFAEDEPSVLRIKLHQAGDTCMMTIGKERVDQSDDTAVSAVLSRYDAKRYVIQIVGYETLTYRCVGGAVYGIQSRGFRLAKVGIGSQPPQ